MVSIAKAGLSGASSVPQTHDHPMTSQDDERNLLCRVAVQDQQAFEILYTRYAPRVRGYLARRLRQPELIDEALQEVMLVLWQQVMPVPPTVPLVAWLCGVARHKARKVLARASAPTVAKATDENSDADEPERELLRQENGRTLARVVDALPHGERTVVKLVSQGCSYQEIAAATGNPVSTIRTRVSRACQRLRTRVAALDHSLSLPLS